MVPSRLHKHPPRVASARGRPLEETRRRVRKAGPQPRWALLLAHLCPDETQNSTPSVTPWLLKAIQHHPYFLQTT